MVLWEITLATAYFLGLRRTYRLSLRLQRRLLRRHPNLKRFVHRRIRTVFDVAVIIHRSIRPRDLGAGKSMGNYILRWLDKVKRSAQVTVPAGKPATNSIKFAITNIQPFRTQGSIVRIRDWVLRGQSFFTPWNIPMKAFPIIAGKSIENSILPWLDKVKRPAQIVDHAGKPTTNSIKFAITNIQPFRTQESIVRIRDRVMSGRSFFAPWNIRMKTFPTIAGKSIGNSILRLFDKVKPSAHIAVHAGKPATNSIKFATTNNQPFRTQGSILRFKDQAMRGQSFFTPWNIPMKTFPTIAMMMQPKPAGTNIQYRHASQHTPNFQALEHRRTGTSVGVFRKDIAQWMQHNS